jgi:general secretion pathway protein G
MKTLRTHLPGAVRAGFSLAELMVVIVILGLLATIVVPNVFSYLSKATVTTAKTDIANLEQAIDSYAINNMGKAPDSIDVLIQPDENGNTYLKGYTEVPLDPWKNPYFYVPPSGNQPYRVGSYGKDGQPGGEGEDADIDNFTIKSRK